ncbi:polysaccharide deacetylase [Serinibacter arcticus]|uniref:Polysaccharide deacetylase n=1 Tax=Serinibacter arcticus TaxID=1655435 RepID=A0A2U1ZSK9_9MICO|nr:polysaccharide deacetylase family protein [Serinibacter arcticus]PWD49923.1 polysaccharide deacetylase [Serinibacter arcticus]
MIPPRDRVLYSPHAARPEISWPGDARIAVWVAPNIEHYEYTPPLTSEARDPWPRTPHPDVQMYSYKDYGNRVGLWRMADLLDELDIRATVSLNMAVMDHFPEVATLIRDLRWKVMSHGIYNTRFSYGLTEVEERAWLIDTIESLHRHTGLTLRGMLGPAISGTLRTPDLMAELGLIYHTDWAHDDVPVPLAVQEGRLISVPYSFDLNDAPLFGANHDSAYFVEIAKRQFDTLYREGGKVMCLALHPFLFGQPHTIGDLCEILRYITGHDDVWMTTADDIAEHYLAHHYDTQLAHASSLLPARSA